MSTVPHLHQFTVTMSDGTIHENVFTTQLTERAYERAAHKHGWPDRQAGAFTYLAFVAWHTLHAMGKYDGTFTEFNEKHALEVTRVSDDESEYEPRPTQATH